MNLSASRTLLYCIGALLLAALLFGGALYYAVRMRVRQARQRDERAHGRPEGDVLQVITDAIKRIRGAGHGRRYDPATGAPGKPVAAPRRTTTMIAAIYARDACLLESAFGRQLSAGEGEGEHMATIIKCVPAWIGVAVVLVLACGLAAGIGTARAAPQVSAWASGINAGLLAVTFVAILWYSVEAQGMRREMIRQNEIAIRPLLMTGIEERKSERRGTVVNMLIVRNIGKWPALFARIEEILLSDEPNQRVTVTFDVVDVIEPGATAVVMARVSLNGREQLSYNTHGAFVASLNPSTAQLNFEVKVMYKDVEGRPHRSVMQMGKAGISLVDHS